MRFRTCAKPRPESSPPRISPRHCRGTRSSWPDRMGQLDGRIAIVTGTSRGVGVGISRRLLEEGAVVIGCSRGPLSALPAAAGLDDDGKRSAQWVCDQSDAAQIDALVRRAVERFGRIDVLVNN